ncbi:hypothetical protein [Dysgonomonas sp. GY617]|uniref:hypothetical protein n=1 Tax=Dysgonomonas sp. GY617 TaxID=2780420 RepID=UPI00188469DF|nr:hypothetical protein [Dysgonomonas sp. GY617]MBF0575451.1 hypothetical protein [Dysgonomonas sp. GY617]
MSDLTSQDQVNEKYGKDPRVAHATTGSTLTQYDNKGNIIGEFTFTNDTKANKYGTVTDMNGNTIDNSKITRGDGYSIFGTSNNSVNATTLHQRFLLGMFSGTSYIGNNNPKTYKGRDSYQYYPRGKAEQAAYQHDLDYDKLKASGLTGAFLTASTYKAYKDLLERCQAILGNPSSTYRDREQAARILGAFGPITASKYVQYTINHALINKNQTIGTSYMNSHISPSLPYMP